MSKIKVSKEQAVTLEEMFGKEAFDNQYEIESKIDSLEDALKEIERLKTGQIDYDKNISDKDKHITKLNKESADRRIKLDEYDEMSEQAKVIERDALEQAGKHAEVNGLLKKQLEASESKLLDASKWQDTANTHQTALTEIRDEFLSSVKDEAMRNSFIEGKVPLGTIRTYLSTQQAQSDALTPPPRGNNGESNGLDIYNQI